MPDYEESRLGMPDGKGDTKESRFSLAKSFIKEDKEFLDGKCLNKKGILDTITEKTVWRDADEDPEFRV